MPKPEWLKCETCLWWEFISNEIRYTKKGDEKITAVGLCNFEILLSNKPIVDSPRFCSHWTFLNCFGSYDSWASRDPVTEQDIYVDHGKCLEARFGI